jgi:ASC-1-like (ASCH) protein
VGTSFASAFRDNSDSGIHLAIFVEPYLEYLLQGRKTIESRFSINRHAPFQQVQVGDLIVVKKAAGPVCALCRVANVWFYRLDPGTWSEITRHAEALCMDSSSFWEKKSAASFATLMEVRDVHRIQEFGISKADPRSWVVLKRSSELKQGSLL